MSSAPLFQYSDLAISIGDKALVHDLDFAIHRGEIVGFIGESGSGKSLSALSIVDLISSELDVCYSSKKVDGLSSGVEGEGLRGKFAAVVFQEPMATFNPTQKLEPQILEHSGATRTQALQLLKELEVENGERLLNAYPHQLSGGQLQRASLAMALIREPKVLIADEPTTALDPVSSNQFLTLLKRTVKDRQIGCLFISHDISSVQKCCDKLVVMCKGKLIETGPCSAILASPKSVYTQELLASEPRFGIYPKELANPNSELQEPQVFATPLIRIEKVSKSFGTTRVLSDINFTLHQGETLGFAGKSGSGKSTLSQIVMGLVDYDGGSISLLEGLHQNQIQIVFQDPYSVLNPKRKVKDILGDVAKKYGQPYPSAVDDILKEVGLCPEDKEKYPREFSGGQRQRINIARALLTQPTVLILDESVAALDIFIQAQVLNLLNRLKESRNLSYLFISHDPKVLDFFCDRLILLQKGEIVFESKKGLWHNDQNPFITSFLGKA